MRVCAVVGLLAASIVAGAPSAHAAEFVVTRTDDPDPGSCTVADCSLREAVIAANANTIADEIILPSPSTTITLSRAGANEDVAVTGDLDILADVTIVGPGTVKQTIADRVFQVRFSANVQFTALRVTGGDVATAGGGIFNGGVTASLTLVRSVVSGNDAGNSGGGILNQGNLDIRSSEISFNDAGDFGGGIQNTGSLQLTNSTVSSNAAEEHGGGIYIHDTGAGSTLTFTTVASNRADSDNNGTGNGGGIMTVEGPGLEGSALVNNRDLNGPDASVGSDCVGIVDSLGFNVLETDSCFGISHRSGGDVVTSNHFISDFLLANGGPTKTHRVFNTITPVINRVPAANALCTGHPQDQRRADRPRGAGCDAGAYELTFCAGKVVNVVGTPGSETLNGTSGDDGIHGLEGVDDIRGLGGDDGLCGQEGDDVLRGGPGDDALVGGPGTNDVCHGNADTDTFKTCETQNQ